MVQKIIHWSLENQWIVLLLSIGLFVAGIFSIQKNPVDAIPDVSENQVIVYTEWMGRSPQVVENQITFPLVTQLQGIPKVKNIRASSMFGMSFIYIIFEDEVDIYWARTRVSERLGFAQKQLPEGIVPTLGPDGTGVGHILWYRIKAKGYDLGELRALQDWYIKLGLQQVKGVSEVASFGGLQKQYQVSLDPSKLTYFRISLKDVMDALSANNTDAGGRKLDIGETAYIIHGNGYLKGISEIEQLAVGMDGNTAIRISDVGVVQTVGEPRLGIFDWQGEEEAVGGIVVMRYGENANEVIRRVKEKMTEVEKGLPEGVSLEPVYDRSDLIGEAIASVRHTLIEEMITVSVVVLVFLFHWRSAFIILIQMPISMAIGFILLNMFGLSSNIMSLTGIALAIGVIVDDGIVMVENAYKHLSES